MNNTRIRILHTSPMSPYGVKSPTQFEYPTTCCVHGTALTVLINDGYAHTFFLRVDVQTTASQGYTTHRTTCGVRRRLECPMILRGYAYYPPIITMHDYAPVTEERVRL